MPLKLPSQRAALKKDVDDEAVKDARFIHEQAEALANELVPDGRRNKAKKKSMVDMAPTTLNLPKSLVHDIEDYVTDCKRNGDGPRSVSAVARLALTQYLSRRGKLKNGG